MEAKLKPREVLLQEREEREARREATILRLIDVGRMQPSPDGYWEAAHPPPLEQSQGEESNLAMKLGAALAAIAYQRSQLSQQITSLKEEIKQLKAENRRLKSSEGQRSLLSQKKTPQMTSQDEPILRD